jgi:hypothetical protein
MQPSRLAGAALFWLATSSLSASSVNLLARSEDLGLEILAMRGVDHERIVILTPQDVVLMRLRWPVVEIRTRLHLPGLQRPARVKAGLISSLGDPASFWLLLNTSTSAQLVNVDGDELTLGAQADRLPWPDLPGGLAFRPGTNIVETTDSTLAGSQIIYAPPSAGSPALTDTGRLLARDPTIGPLGPDSPTVGPPLLLIAPGLCAATSARPPSTTDALLLLRMDAGVVKTVATLAVDGTLTGLARLPGPTRTLMIVAALRVAVGTQLLLCEITP